MDYVALKTELDTDPLTRGYAGMAAADAAIDMNTIYRTRQRDAMSGDEVFNATDATEFTGLTESKQTLWVSFTSKDVLDPYASANIDFVDFVFGGGSTTRSNLQALRVESVSRAVELGLGIVKTGDVEFARSL